MIHPRQLLRLLPSLLALGILATACLAAKRPRALEEVFVVLARGPVWHFQSSSGSDVTAVPLKTGDKLAIGSTLGTGEGGMMRILLGGHTIVDLTPQAVVGFPGRADSAKGNGGIEERIVVLRGAVRTHTDRRYLADDLAVSLITDKSKQTSRGGSMGAAAMTEQERSDNEN